MLLQDRLERMESSPPLNAQSFSNFHMDLGANSQSEAHKPQPTQPHVCVPRRIYTPWHEDYAGIRPGDRSVVEPSSP